MNRSKDSRRYREEDVTGMIELGYRYLYQTNKLQIHIKKCWDLVHNEGSRIDPYIKIYLMPDTSKSGKRKTQVLRDTSKPVFERKLEFDIQKDELENRTLYVSLWHHNSFGHNTLLGELSLPLSAQLQDVYSQTYQLVKKPVQTEDVEEVEEEFEQDVDDEYYPDSEYDPYSVSASIDLPPPPSSSSSSSSPYHYHYPRSPASDGSHYSPSLAGDRANTPDLRRLRKVDSPRLTKHDSTSSLKSVLYSGDVLLAIKYVPAEDMLVVFERDFSSKGEIHLCIKRGMNLPGYGAKGETNAYCKLRILKEGKVLLKYRTGVIEAESDPEWEARRRLENVNKNDIEDTIIEITVCNKLQFGHTTIGMGTVSITGERCDWSRAKCLTNTSINVDDLLSQANHWAEILIPLRPYQLDK